MHHTEKQNSYFYQPREIRMRKDTKSTNLSKITLFIHRILIYFMSFIFQQVQDLKVQILKTKDENEALQKELDATR